MIIVLALLVGYGVYRAVGAMTSPGRPAAAAPPSHHPSAAAAAPSTPAPTPTHVSHTVVIRLKNDFGLTLANSLPALGSASRSLRVISNSWNSERTQLIVEVSGMPGIIYELEVWNPAQISSVEGAVLTRQGKIQLEIPSAKSADYSHHKMVIHFGKS